MGWQPIETAPRDGTVVDLWAEWNRGAVRVPNMRWTSSVKNPRIVGWFDNFYGHGSNYAEEQFTHWMPLPEAPAHD